MNKTFLFCLQIACLIVAGSGAKAALHGPNILYCLGDDWGWPYAGAYGDKAVRTPTFDRVAREGILFTHAFSAAPSCTPSRAAMLTGQYPHRLEQGGVLWGFLPKKFPVYTELLEQAGYYVGFTRKGWGPGDFQAGGYAQNPAGKSYKSFGEFLAKVPKGTPFCFWFGSNDPHRPYERGSGATKGLDAGKVRVPAYWPDNPVTRSDMLDYYFEVERFDTEVGELLGLLEQQQLLENTLVVVTGDNGCPFPRCKANLYDGGTRQPLAVRWSGKVKPGQVSDDFVNLMDLAPTFLEAAGLKPPAEMTGRSLLGLLTGKELLGTRDVVFLERERHANVRAGDVGYPVRAIRTREFLYIRNFRPERWPAGDPQAHKDPKHEFGDVDDGPTKNYILAHANEPGMERLFALSFGKRPAEELYDIKTDPDQVNDLAGDPRYAGQREQLRARLDKWMRETADPRAFKDADPWDAYPYYGGVAGVGATKAR